jgi:CheY-like chemotaxis protein
MAITTQPPSLVVLDIGLAGELDGWALLGELRARPTTRNVPVVVVSGRDERSRGQALGVDDYVLKGGGADGVVASLTRMLGPNVKRVLVVEDDSSSRQFVEQAMADMGVEVLSVATGGQALDELAKAPRSFGAVVLDLGLPDIDGLDVLDRMRANPMLRDLRVVIYTARDLAPDERKRLAERAAETVRKGNGVPIREAIERALSLAEVP